MATAAVEEAFVDVVGQRLWTSVRGRGESSIPLLLIMGFGGQLTLWDRFRAALGPHETIAFDLPGMGLSSPPRLPSRARGTATMIVEMLDRLGYGEVDVLGISLGGGLAQELAHRAPRRVRRLILCSTSTGSIAIPGAPSALLKLVIPPILGSPPRVDEELDVAGDGSERGALRGKTSSFAGYGPTLRGYAAQLYGAAGWTSLPWLHTIAQPTLVLAGERDKLVPPANARLLARLLPNAHLVLVPDAGHLFLLRDPDEPAFTIREFLF